MAPNEAILGIFVHVDDLLSALKRLKTGGHTIKTVFSPLPLREVHEILGPKTSAVRFIVFFGGLLGALSLVSLAVYAHLSFKLITSGKPILPWVPWVVVCFEGTILGGVIAAIVSWVLKGKLPRLHPPKGYDGAFSRDRFGVLVGCPSDENGFVRKLLEEEGAEEVRLVF